MIDVEMLALGNVGSSVSWVEILQTPERFDGPLRYFTWLRLLDKR